MLHSLPLEINVHLFIGHYRLNVIIFITNSMGKEFLLVEIIRNNSINNTIYRDSPEDDSRICYINRKLDELGQEKVEKNYPLNIQPIYPCFIESRKNYLPKLKNLICNLLWTV